MQSDLIDVIVAEQSEAQQSETHLRSSSTAEHSPDQLAFAPPEPARNLPTPEAVDKQQAGGMFLPGPGTVQATMRAVRDRFRSSWSYLLVAVILLLALAAGVGGGIIGARLAPAPSVPPATLQQQVESVSLSVRPSVVQVRSEAGSERGLGSGIIMTKDGYIATNDHVVNGFRTYTVLLFNGQSLTAQLVGEDSQNDLAVLKVAAGNLTPITFADSSAVQVGQFVVALGSPLGLANTTTFGIVSALNRTVIETSGSSVPVEYFGMIQLDMTVNPGISGGALIDLQGRLVGMPNLRVESTSSGAHIDGIGFALPANLVKAVTAQLIHARAAGQ